MLMGKSIRLQATLNLWLKQKTTEYFVLCLQEIKCLFLKGSQKPIYGKFKLQFDFYLTSDRSGGLLFSWS